MNAFFPCQTTQQVSKGRSSRSTVTLGSMSMSTARATRSPLAPTLKKSSDSLSRHESEASDVKKDEASWFPPWPSCTTTHPMLLEFASYWLHVKLLFIKAMNSKCSNNKLWFSKAFIAILASLQTFKCTNMLWYLSEESTGSGVLLQGRGIWKLGSWAWGSWEANLGKWQLKEDVCNLQIRMFLAWTSTSRWFQCKLDCRFLLLL